MQHRRQFKDSTDRGRCQEQYFSGFWPLQGPQRPSQAIFHQWAHLAPPPGPEACPKSPALTGLKKDFISEMRQNFGKYIYRNVKKNTVIAP